LTNSTQAYVSKIDCVTHTLDCPTISGTTKTVKLSIFHQFDLVAIVRIMKSVFDSKGIRTYPIDPEAKVEVHFVEK
jgi:hypothetical protein